MTQKCAKLSTAPPPVLLVVAKAPVPGFAKTRLAARVGPEAAAELAAASLLDTLAAAAGTGWPIVVALTGELDRARRAGELREALAACTVIDQRGRDLGERLAAAHTDAATVSGGRATVQIGADTPQVEAAGLVAAYHRLVGRDAVVGPAVDGGWWLLAVRQPAIASCLPAVPMSRSDTGMRTVRALRDAGWRVAATESLRDVDTARDAEAVAAAAPESRFAAAWAAAAGAAAGDHHRVAQDRGSAGLDTEISRHSTEALRQSTPPPETAEPQSVVPR